MKRQRKAERGDEPQYDPLLVGYARVSTDDQDPQMQIEALQRARVHPDNIHVETISGASKKRPARDLARRQLREGMTLVVWSIDRLGRDHIDLYAFVRDCMDKGIGVKSLTQPIDTTSPWGEFALIMMSASAQLERRMIQQRTNTGIKSAIERGVKFGQPTKITPDIVTKVDKWLHQGLSVPQIVERFDSEGTKLAESTIRKYWKAEQIERARKGKRNKIIIP